MPSLSSIPVKTMNFDDIHADKYRMHLKDLSSHSISVFLKSISKLNAHSKAVVSYLSQKFGWNTELGMKMYGIPLMQKKGWLEDNSVTDAIYQLCALQEGRDL